ncbi:hypothetical protein BLNAU_1100 [Blattamonas nauphoetae]|uniref:Uncharacterized protein n=1 Tax=Blattamonas nauphoetae TaxID=2049346 RepID=A0ABQ9YJS8_9EUKA|nr:hypothetical protein BLNAU_1100 [Blattamonas nauphoetae]
MILNGIFLISFILFPLALQVEEVQEDDDDCGESPLSTCLCCQFPFSSRFSQCCPSYGGFGSGAAPASWRNFPNRFNGAYGQENANSAFGGCARDGYSGNANCIGLTSQGQNGCGMSSSAYDNETEFVDLTLVTVTRARLFNNRNTARTGLGNSFGESCGYSNGMTGSQGAHGLSGWSQLGCGCEGRGGGYGYW